MGYYTEWDFSYHREQSENSMEANRKFNEFLRETCRMRGYDCGTFDEIQDEGGKYYYMNEALVEATKTIRDITIIADCLGEDGERSRIYARNGKTQEVKAIITYPECTL